MYTSPMNYSDYQHILFEKRANGILWMTLNRPEVQNAADATLHTELVNIRHTIDADPDVRVALEDRFAMILRRGARIRTRFTMILRRGAQIWTRLKKKIAMILRPGVYANTHALHDDSATGCTIPRHTQSRAQLGRKKPSEA